MFFNPRIISAIAAVSRSINQLATRYPNILALNNVPLELPFVDGSAVLFVKRNSLLSISIMVSPKLIQKSVLRHIELQVTTHLPIKSFASDIYGII